VEEYLAQKRQFPSSRLDTPPTLAIGTAGMSQRVDWPPGSHERAVERFYSHGGNSGTEIHRGYLNFGLWEDTDDYLRAAENLARRLGELLGLAPGSRLLDVTCGMAAQDIYLHRTFGPLEIDAIDLTWRHVERALRRVHGDGLDEHIRVRQGSATQLPFPDGTFTHVMALEGPLHFNTRRRFFDEAFRVLQPGGVVAVADHILRRWPRNAAERVVLQAARVLWRVPRTNLGTAREYQQEMVAAGFRHPTVRHVGELTYPGYFNEQRRPAFRREMERIQGSLKARVGFIINVAAHRAYRTGLLDYILVRADTSPDREALRLPTGEGLARQFAGTPSRHSREGGNPSV
jgi:ubiquinone/menaquinone biosynthesis C-methylase UbiE